MGTARRASKAGHELMSASALKGDVVVNTKGEKLGILEEVMINIETAQVNYGIVAMEGDKLVTVPWDAVAVDTRNRRLVIDIDKQNFERAPSFDRDHWPEMDREWQVKVQGFYGRKPFWDLAEERWISGP